VNTKTKTLIGIVLFVVFLVAAYTAYTSLSDHYKPNNQIRLPEITSTPENSLKPQTTSIPEISTTPEVTVYEAPDFTVFDSAGNEIHLSDFAGKSVVLNFWASWCPPCKSEMPHFNEVYTSLQDDDIVFMMVDLTDGARETQKDGQTYVDDQGYDFPVYFDTKQEAAYAYGISSIPTTIFIDSDGNIATGYQGEIDEETLIAGIELIKDQK